MDLMCNVSTCRKSLTGTLWVTSCSHSFCEEHASALALPHKSIKCPACNTVLGKRYDVIRQNSNPGEQYRAMLLVGLRPEIVLDIAKRAMSFWNYQVEQVFKFQYNSAKHLKESVEKMKEHLSSQMRQLLHAKKTSTNYENQIKYLRSSNKILKDQLALKNKELQEIQLLFQSVQTNANLSIQNGEINGAGSFVLSGHNAPKDSDFVFEPLITVKKRNL